MRIRRKSFEMVAHVFMKILILDEHVGELSKLLAIWQVSVDEEIRRLNERGTFGQFLDWNAAIAQDPLLAVDEGD